MKRRYWLAALLTTVVAAITLWEAKIRGTNETSKETENYKTAPSDQKKETSDFPPNASATTNTETTPSATQKGMTPDSRKDSERLYQAYRCPTGKKCKDATTATNPAMAQWLKDRGYPTQQDLKDAKLMNVADLAKKAQESPVWRALYAERILEQGAQMDASREALRSMADGSLYGAYVLSDVYAAPGLLQDKLNSLAALRMAYIMGDESAGQELYYRSSGIAPPDMAYVDQQGMQMYRNFLKYRYKMYGYGLRVTPRPEPTKPIQ